jgi:hypothetical protein
VAQVVFILKQVICDVDWIALIWRKVLFLLPKNYFWTYYFYQDIENGLPKDFQDFNIWTVVFVSKKYEWRPHYGIWKRVEWRVPCTQR